MIRMDIHDGHVGHDTGLWMNIRAIELFVWYCGSYRIDFINDYCYRSAKIVLFNYSDSTNLHEFDDWY